MSDKLNLLSPLNVLNRGYSICRKTAGDSIVKDARSVKITDELKIHLAKGEIIARVEGLK